MKTSFISRQCDGMGWARALAAGLTLLAPLGGCKGSGATDALLQFVDALNGRDAQAPYHMLAKKTRTRLETASEDLRKKTGGAVLKKPYELVSWVGVGMKRGKRAVHVVKEDADVAVLKVDLERGGDEEVTLRKEDGKWKIELDTEPRT